MKRKIYNSIKQNIGSGGYLRLLSLSNIFRSQKRPVNMDLFLHTLNNGSDGVFFIQIGANDGVKNDPINPLIKAYHWKGILVEPLPDFFQRLKENYKEEKQLTFENAGIAEQSADLDFYYLPEECNEPDWVQQIGTFDRNAIEFNLEKFPQLIPKIVSRKIKTITLAQLIEKHQVKKIDLIVIDAEGFEYKILSQLPSLPVKPRHILFEWGCMAAETLEMLKKLLNTEGYKLYKSGGDILAVKK